MADRELERLRRAVPDWIADVRYLAETDSTNRVAGQWAAGGAPHGCLVVADYQSAGRGRLDRRWLAPPATSILASLVLRPQLPLKQWSLIGLAGAAALAEYLHGQGVSSGVKWPNDVLLGERKVAGLLAEASGEVLVLGLGVNVAQAAFPEEIAGIATSLQDHTGRRFARWDVLGGWLVQLGDLLEHPGSIPGAYRRWCRTIGSRVRVDLGTEAVEDRARDIDDEGALILEGGRTVVAGDVLQLR